MTTTFPPAGPTPGGTDDAAADRRVQRLNRASVARVIDPSSAAELAGRVGEGQLIPDELLSVAGLGLDLTTEQRARLSREETASILQAGVEFEAILMAGLALEVAYRSSGRDPRSTYALHEIGEETRHSRLFLELIDQIDPRATNPLARPWLMRVSHLVDDFIIRHPATLYTLILGGEEIPDLLQQLASEHPGTDPHVAAVNRYHRSEEARHLAYARLRVGEVWRDAGAPDRWGVRHLAPLVIGGMFDLLVHPGVYETVGLPGWDTWRAVRADPHRRDLRHRACRPVLDALVGAGVLRAGRVPRGWRSLCGVDRWGQPVGPVAPSDPTVPPATTAPNSSGNTRATLDVR
jgi:hypothetical protein